jgi:hypothetical protein
MSKEESGMLTGTEWRKTVWQRSTEIIVHREYVVEAEQRKDGNRVST